MCSLDGESLAVLRELHERRREQLDGLSAALKSLLALAEDFRQRTGSSVPPWELWAAIVQQLPAVGQAETVTSR